MCAAKKKMKLHWVAPNASGYQDLRDASQEALRLFFVCVQISDVIERFERKGYKLVGLKLIKPTKAFAEKHYDDLKGRPFFNDLTDFLSSGPVVAMVRKALWSSAGRWLFLLQQDLLLLVSNCLRGPWVHPVTLSGL